MFDVIREKIGWRGIIWYNWRNGSVAEWLKAHAWKACKGLRSSQVRILSLPPEANNKNTSQKGLFLLCSLLVSQDSLISLCSITNPVELG